MRIAVLSPYPTFPHHQELGCRHISYQNNATWTTALVSHLAQIPDTDVHVLTEADDIPAGRAVVAAPHLTIHYLKAPRRFKTLTLWQFDRQRLHRRLRELQPDIVHGQGIETQYGYATATCPYPKVITLHGIAELSNQVRGAGRFSRERWVEWFTHYCLARTRYLVVVSPFIRDYYQLGPPRHQVFHLRNPVSEVFFAAPSQVREPDLLLAIGYVDRLKAHDLLLRAMVRLRQRSRNVRAIIVGPATEPAQLAKLQALIRQEKLPVEFTGFLPPPAVLPLLQRATVLVHPSRLETFGMAIAEAMATATPVLAARVGGIPSLVEDGQNGRLFESENVVDLADKLQELLDNAVAREALGQRARAFARAQLAPAHIAQQTREMYTAILQSERPAAACVASLLN